MTAASSAIESSLHRKGVRDVEQTKQATKNAHIRWMIRRDMPDVLGIESNCFEFSWTEDDFIRCLRQRNCIGMVAEMAESG